MMPLLLCQKQRAEGQRYAQIVGLFCVVGVLLSSPVDLKILVQVNVPDELEGLTHHFVHGMDPKKAPKVLARKLTSNVATGEDESASCATRLVAMCSSGGCGCGRRNGTCYII